MTERLTQISYDALPDSVKPLADDILSRGEKTFKIVMIIIWEKIVVHRTYTLYLRAKNKFESTGTVKPFYNMTVNE